MSGAAIRWDRREEKLVIPDKAVYHRYSPTGRASLVEGYVSVNARGWGEAFGQLSVMSHVSLSSLRKALMAAVTFYEGTLVAEVGDDNDSIANPSADELFSLSWAAFEEEFDEDNSLAAAHDIVLHRDGTLTLKSILATDPRVAEYGREPEMFGLDPEDLAEWPEGRAAARYWLENRGLSLLGFEPVGSAGREGDLWCARIELPGRGWTIGMCAALGEELTRFMSTLTEIGGMNEETVRTLLKTGFVHALVGSFEDEMLEAKAALRMDTEQDGFEIAKDVSAFANSDRGGVLVYGLETRRRHGRDVIHAVHPFAPAGQDRAVHRVLDRRIVPPVEGLEATLVPVGSTGECVLMVYVPPQPAELRPFLVKGAVVGGKVNGNLIAVYRRRGDDVLPTSAEGLHTALAAGLAFLRGANHFRPDAPPDPSRSDGNSED